MHYKRWRRNGTTKKQTVEERFLARLTKVGDCWVVPFTDPAGYGGFHVDGVRYLAHRWSYEHFVGPIPDGLELDHLCRNRGCANPAHLEPVTRRENALRGPGSKTACVHGHPYTSQNTYIRPDRGTRQCRECGRNRSSQFDLRRRMASKPATRS